MALLVSSWCACTFAAELGLQAVEVGWRRVELVVTGAPRDGSSVKLACRLSRKREGSEWLDVALLPPGAARHEDTGVEPGTCYVYRASLVSSAETGILRGGNEAVPISIDLEGARELVLVATDGGDGNGNDHATWGTPRLVRADGAEVRLATIQPKLFKLGYGERRQPRTITIGWREYPDSIWAHAASRIVYHLPEGFSRFEAAVGIDASQKPKGTVAFRVEIDRTSTGGAREIEVRTRDVLESPGRTTYYVDSKRGDDSNPGTRRTRPWKSLDRVNSVVFAPGDRLLFKSGARWRGWLKPSGSGKEGAPVAVATYGGRAKARIDGEGEIPATVHLFNVEHWEVSGLEVTNTGQDRQAYRKGVYVEIRDFGTAHGITVRDLYVHDVNSSLVKKEGGAGIAWNNGGDKVRSRFDGLLIEDCHLVRCERNGIGGGGYWVRDNWYPSLNVVVRGNLLEEIPGDGIVPFACDGALVEHNVMRECTRLLGDAAAGIWPWSCDNTVIQFNEVSDHKAPWDAQGFDSDYNCRNTVIQYNYSHDNEGGFLLVCNDGSSRMPWNIGNQGTVVRYNISVNDGLRAVGKHAGFSPTFHISGPCKDTRIYNNVIYVTRKLDAKIDRTIVRMDNWGGPWPEDTYFANNIFYVEGEADWELRGARRTVLENNCFFGEQRDRPEGRGAVLADPLFAGPVSARAGLDSLEGFMLRPGSPCVGAGAIVPDNGGRDFWGVELPEGVPNIGASEKR